MSIKCSYIDCENKADYIDNMDNYVCEEHMTNALEDDYVDQEPEDFERLDWEKFPENGFSV